MALTSSNTGLIAEGLEKSALIAISAALEISSLGLLETAIVLKPLSERYLTVARPVLGPAPRMRAMLDAILGAILLPLMFSMWNSAENQI